MTDSKRFKPFIVYFLLMSFVGLVACGSSSKTENPIATEPDSSLPNNSTGIVDNSASADYNIIIYGNSHSAKLATLLEQLISSELSNSQVATLTVSGRFLDEIVNSPEYRKAKTKQVESCDFSRAKVFSIGICKLFYGRNRASNCECKSAGNNANSFP